MKDLEKYPRLNLNLQEAPAVGSRLVESYMEEMGTAGSDILRLKPYPSRPLPPHVIEAIRQASHEQACAPSRGLAEFRNAAASSLRSELSVEFDPGKNILATNGGMHALYVIFLALLNPGDEVLVPSPCYFLEGIIKPLGGKIVYAPMDETRDYAWDLDRLESKITANTKCFFVNTPVNPTGRVLSEGDLYGIAKLADKYDFFVIADESYNTLVYDGHRHISLAGFQLAQPRTLLIRSFTKSFAMPGWRVAFIAGPALLIDVITKALEWNVLYCAHINQIAATAVLEGPKDWLGGIAEEFQASRDLICERISSIGVISAPIPAGGPFLFINVSCLGRSSDDVSAILLKNFGVPTTPGRFFQGPGHIRMAFGAPSGILNEAADRLEQLVKLIRKRND